MPRRIRWRFSALQRAEIAEIEPKFEQRIFRPHGFSALQRAEIAEIIKPRKRIYHPNGFSALQRAEIAEMRVRRRRSPVCGVGFSALQRAEIAEIDATHQRADPARPFQCSSTSRNC